ANASLIHRVDHGFAGRAVVADFGSASEWFVRRTFHNPINFTGGKFVSQQCFFGSGIDYSRVRIDRGDIKRLAMRDSQTPSLSDRKIVGALVVTQKVTG